MVEPSTVLTFVCCAWRYLGLQRRGPLVTGSRADPVKYWSKALKSYLKWYQLIFLRSFFFFLTFGVKSPPNDPWYGSRDLGHSGAILHQMQERSQFAGKNLSTGLSIMLMYQGPDPQSTSLVEEGARPAAPGEEPSRGPRSNRPCSLWFFNSNLSIINQSITQYREKGKSR